MFTGTLIDVTLLWGNSVTKTCRATQSRFLYIDVTDLFLVYLMFPL
jgi:hypothetical protein